MLHPLTSALDEDEHPPFQSNWSGKGDVVPVHAMKEYRGSRGTAPLILNPTMDGDEWPISRPGRFTPGKRTSIPFEQKDRCTPERVWTVWTGEKSLAPAEI
jgi:hypothetical protein